MLSVKQAQGFAHQLTSDTARLDVDLLLCHALGKSRTWLFTWPEHPLSEQQESAFRQAFARRLAGEPVAHITGRRDFWSLSLRVNNSTLIPRPDTETLVEWALGLSLPEQARVLDLGTGTGAIALALATERSGWRITGTDVNADALALADVNAREHHCALTLIESRWFDAIPAQTFDLIVSNPPYIAADDPHLDAGDVRFEPRTALVADQYGLADIHQICEHAGRFLTAGGWLGIEHGFEQAPAVQDLFTNAGFTQVTNLKDLAGQPRITVGQHRSEQRT